MISVAITSWNRCQMTIDCFANITDNDFISEFIIVDDASIDGSPEILKAFFKDNSKVKVFFNKENLGMSRNKELAVRLCKEDYVLIADSDNIFDNGYIDAFKKVFFEDHNNFQDKFFYMPDFAMPAFDYRKFSGCAISKNNIKEFMDKPMFEQLMNTCNMIVPRKRYLDIYEHNGTVKEVDTLWMNYLWLKEGNQFFVVPGMEYFHNIHSGSGWLSHAKENIEKAKEINKLIMEL